VGSQSGNAGPGTAIGAGFGAIFGGLLGISADARERRLSERDEMLERQRAEIDRQRRELQDLRRQRYWDREQVRYRRSRGVADEPEANYPQDSVRSGDRFDRSDDRFDLAPEADRFTLDDVK
jgi:hypothetical protein